MQGRNTDEKVSAVTMKTYILSKRTIRLHHNVQDFSPDLCFILRNFFQALHMTDLHPPKVHGSFFFCPDKLDISCDLTDKLQSS